jgi:hypothetical protein
LKKKNLPHGFDKSADLLSKGQNHEEYFFKLCVLLKKSELCHIDFQIVVEKYLHIYLVKTKLQKKSIMLLQNFFLAYFYFL